MNDLYEIRYQHTPKEPFFVVGWFQGTKKEASEHAQDLLQDMRERGLNKSQVAVDGHRVRLKREDKGDVVVGP